MVLNFVVFTFIVSLTFYVSAATNNAPRYVHQLLARQSTINPDEIPPLCANRCAETISTLNDCVEFPRLACGCSLFDESRDVDCYNCLLFSDGVVPPPESVRSVQAFLNEYVDNCNAAGVGLPSTSLSLVPTQQVVTMNPGQTPALPTELFPSLSLPAPSSVVSGENKNSMPVVGAVVVAAALLGFLF